MVSDRVSRGIAILSFVPSICRNALALGVAPLALLAYKDGPPADSSGGFGARSCHACHLDNALNAPGGSLAVKGIPRSYTAGRTYRVTVSVSREQAVRAGFQISARFADGRQAGAWRALDSRTQVIHSQQEPRVEFGQHTAAGTEQAAWTLEWTAPGGGTVVFHAAANASDDDASPLGDFVYLAELRSEPE